MPLEPKSLDEVNIDELDSRDLEFKDFMDRHDPRNTSSNITYTLPTTYELGEVSITQEAIDNVSMLYEEYNAKYGFELKIKSDDINQMFRSIIDPKNKKILELYIVELYGRARLVMYQKLLLMTFQLIDDMYKNSTDPSIQVENKYIMLEKVLEYLYKINEVYDQIKNDKSEQELEQLSKESRESSSYDYNDPDVQEVIEKLSKTILEDK